MGVYYSGDPVKYCLKYYVLGGHTRSELGSVFGKAFAVMNSDYIISSRLSHFEGSLTRILLTRFFAFSLI